MATGFNIDWKGGDLIATKDKIRQIELAKSPTKEAYPSAQHMLSIFLVSHHVPFVHCVRELRQASQFR
jgi:hypothetical protein